MNNYEGDYFGFGGYGDDLAPPAGGVPETPVTMAEPEDRSHAPEQPPAQFFSLIGVGGCGGNVVSGMPSDLALGIQVYAANTDAQALAGLPSHVTPIALNVPGAEGYGAGANPAVGALAAEASLANFGGILAGSRMAFIVAGLGGGTGTGAAPVIARHLRDNGVLTIGVAIMPEDYCGKEHLERAEAGLQQLAAACDSIFVLSNQRIKADTVGFADAYRVIDDYVHELVRTVAKMITIPANENVDFADFRTVFTLGGYSFFSTYTMNSGDNLDYAAAKLTTPELLEGVVSTDAKQALVFSETRGDFTYAEFRHVMEQLGRNYFPEANRIGGKRVLAAGPDEPASLTLTLVLTGLELTGYPPVSFEGAELQANAPVELSVVRRAPLQQPAEVADGTALEQTEGSVSRERVPAAAVDEPEQVEEAAVSAQAEIPKAMVNNDRESRVNRNAGNAQRSRLFQGGGI